jgi:predicted oxidoreductase
VIPIAGTVNVARIQTLHKAVALELENEDWFAIWSESMGQEFLKNALLQHSTNTIKHFK